MAAKSIKPVRTNQEQVDTGALTPKQMMTILSDLIHKMSNGNLPSGMSEAEVKDYIRDNI